MGSFPKAERIMDDGAINRIVPASEPGALAPVRPSEAPDELWEWLRLLNRRKALIVGCGLVAVALMALIIAQATPMYKASARLLLDTRTFKVVSTEAALSGVDTMNLGAIQSELEVIQSEFLIGRVVDKLGLANNPDFNGTKPPGFIDSAFAPLRELWATGISTLLAPAPKPQPATAQPARTSRPAEESDPRRRAAIGTVSGGLSVTLVGRTFVILITVESPDGTMSARIANAVAEAYLADQIDTKNEANRRATEWLEQRLAELRRNLQVAEEAVASYRRDKGLAGSPEGAVSTPDAVGSQQQVRQRAHQAHRARGAPRRPEQGQPQSRRDRQHCRGVGQHHAGGAAHPGRRADAQDGRAVVDAGRQPSQDGPGAQRARQRPGPLPAARPSASRLPCAPSSTPPRPRRTSSRSWSTRPPSSPARPASTKPSRSSSSARPSRTAPSTRAS